ncbi:MAG: OsmC family protein [bacterium]
MAHIKAKIGKEHYITEIVAGNNMIISDEPVSEGGNGEGFSPFYLLAASLGSCTAITLRMYADKKGWDLESCEVNIAFDQENGTSVFKKDILLIGDLNDEQKQRLLMIADKCFIHKILTNSIEINTGLI